MCVCVCARARARSRPRSLPHPQILGSTDVLGNPTAAFSAFGQGFRELVSGVDVGVPATGTRVGAGRTGVLVADAGQEQQRNKTASACAVAVARAGAARAVGPAWSRD